MRTFRREATNLFLIGVFLIIPVLFRYNYQDITSFKSIFYIGIACILMICGIIVFLGQYFRDRSWGVPQKSIGETIKSLSILDAGMLCFGCVVFLSVITTRNSIASAFLGENAAFVGGGVLFLLCISYFILSRYTDPERKTWIYSFYISSFFVTLLEVLNHLGIDPLGMHQNNSINTQVFMSGTIGNVDFAYGYFSMVILFFSAVRLELEFSRKSVAVDILLLICFIAMWTARASSVFLGLFYGAAFLVYFAMKSFKRFKSLFWVGLLCGLGGCAAELIHLINPMIFDRTEPEISGYLMQRHLYLAVGLICLVIYLLLRGLEKKEKDEGFASRLVAVRPYYFGVVCAFLLVFMFLVFLLPQLKAISGRKVIWDEIFNIYSSGNIREKLIGIGPGTDDVSVERMGLKFVEADRMETAHNEILEYFLTTGIIGVLSYLAIIIGAFLSFFSMSSDENGEKEAGYALAAFAAFIGQGLTNGPNPLPTIIAFTMVAMLRRYQIPEEDEF